MIVKHKIVHFLTLKRGVIVGANQICMTWLINDKLKKTIYYHTTPNILLINFIFVAILRLW